MVRAQLWYGGDESPCVRFKARLLIVMLESIWVINLAACVKLETGLDVVKGQLMIVYMLAFICGYFFNHFCLSTVCKFDSVSDVFRDWPVNKRARWDLGVVVFVIATFAALICLARAFRSNDIHSL